MNNNHSHKQHRQQQGVFKRNDKRVRVKTMSGEELYCHPGAVRLLFKERSAVISEVTLIDKTPRWLIESAKESVGDITESGSSTKGQEGKELDTEGADGAN
jgi:hypothetical protein